MSTSLVKIAWVSLLSGFLTVVNCILITLMFSEVVGHADFFIMYGVTALIILEVT